MVQLPGLEPGTFGSTIRRSNQLSYSCTGHKTERKLVRSLAQFKTGKGLLTRTGPFGEFWSESGSAGLTQIAERLEHALLHRLHRFLGQEHGQLTKFAGLA